MNILFEKVQSFLESGKMECEVKEREVVALMGVKKKVDGWSGIYRMFWPFIYHFNLIYCFNFLPLFLIYFFLFKKKKNYEQKIFFYYTFKLYKHEQEFFNVIRVISEESVKKMLVYCEGFGDVCLDVFLCCIRIYNEGWLL